MNIIWFKKAFFFFFLSVLGVATRGCVRLGLMGQPLCTRLTCEGTDMAECLSVLDSRGPWTWLRPTGHLRGAER